MLLYIMDSSLIMERFSSYFSGKNYNRKIRLKYSIKLSNLEDSYFILNTFIVLHKYE